MLSAGMTCFRAEGIGSYATSNLLALSIVR